MSTTVRTATDIHPFHVDIPDGQLATLRQRIEATPGDRSAKSHRPDEKRRSQ